MAALTEPEVRYVERDGVSIAFCEYGSGPVDLLYVPGFVSHLGLLFENELVADFVQRLASFARLIFFDKRGQGLSDPGPYTLESITADALAVLDAAGAEQAALFGVSEGGSAATMIAGTHPERITSMVQFGTYARISDAPDYPEGFSTAAIEEFQQEMRKRWGDPETLRLWGPTLADDPEQREWWSRLMRWGASPGIVATLLEMYRSLDVRPLLPLVRIPSLIAWRADDGIVPASHSRVVAEGIPGAKGLELPGADHLFFAGDTEPLLEGIESFLTGRRPAPPRRRVLSTVLFTDLVDSTTQVAELGDRIWRSRLEDCARRWRHAVEGYDGRLVKTTGDGLLATFDGPAQAVRAALALRETTRSLDLETRSGIHTGECELVGNDIAGIAVHIAARAESAGRPGEVTTTGTVKDLVIGSGLSFEERGTHELKGVPGQWPLYAAREA